MCIRCEKVDQSVPSALSVGSCRQDTAEGKHASAGWNEQDANREGFSRLESRTSQVEPSKCGPRLSSPCWSCGVSFSELRSGYLSQDSKHRQAHQVAVSPCLSTWSMQIGSALLPAGFAFETCRWPATVSSSRAMMRRAIVPPHWTG